MLTNLPGWINTLHLGYGRGRLGAPFLPSFFPSFLRRPPFSSFGNSTFVLLASARAQLWRFILAILVRISMWLRQTWRLYKPVSPPFIWVPPICIQGPAKKQFPGCENFVLAVAYHFCLALPEKFSQPGNHSFAGPCIWKHPNGKKWTSPNWKITQE